MKNRLEKAEEGILIADELAETNPLFLLDSQLEFLEGNLAGKEEMKSEYYGWIPIGSYGGIYLGS